MQRVGVQAVVEGLPNYLSASAQIESANARINKSTESAAVASQKFGAGLQESSLLAGKALLAVEVGAAALAAAFVTAGVRAAEFEKAMAGIQAVSGASAAEMKQLSDAAMTAGTAFGFSATESAAGIEALIKAGVSIQDILGGALPAALTLAAAGEISVSDAAEIASNAINQFSLKGADMAHVADVIAGAANASAIDVKDFQLSLQQAGAVAATSGESFDSTAQAIAVMGSAGIRSSDAGTSLKTMLMNLQPQSKNAAEVMQLLGLRTKDGANAFFDAEGKVKSFRDIADVLHTSLKDLTEQQKLATLSIIFGSDAARAAAVFAREGAAGFDEMAASMGKVSAEDVAGKRLDSLEGDLKKLRTALDNVAITAGQETTPALRDATQALTDMVTQGAPVAVWLETKLAIALRSAAQGAAILAHDINTVDFGNLAKLMQAGAALPIIGPGLAAGGLALAAEEAVRNNTARFQAQQAAALAPAMAGIASQQASEDAISLTTQDFTSLTASIDDFSHSLADTGKTAAAVSPEAAALRKQLNDLLNTQLMGKGAAKEQKSALQELGVSFEDIRKAGELAKLSQQTVDAAILKLGGTILDTGPIVDGFGKTTVRLAAAFNAAGLDGDALVATIQAQNAAAKAKAEADKEAAKQAELNSAAAGHLATAMEGANFSLDEQRRILGALGVDLLDIGPKIDGVGVTADRLAADFQRAGLSADEAAAAIKRVTAAADAAKASQAAVTNIQGVATRDVLGNIRSREPQNAAASAAELGQAASALTQLKAAGQDLGVALDIVNGHLGALRTRFAELTGDDKASAGALMDKLDKLRAGYEAGTISLEDYQKALQDAQGELGRLAGVIDDADRAAAKLAADAALRIAQDAAAAATERANSALALQRDELNYNLGPAWTRVGQTMAQAMKVFQDSIDKARRSVDELVAEQNIILARQGEDIESGQRAREAASKFAAAIKPGEAPADIAKALQDALAGGGRPDNTFQTIFFGMVTAALEQLGIHVAPRIGQGLSSAIADALGIPSFGAGGMVGGPLGAPRLIMAHGGETVVPRMPDLVMLPPSTSQGGQVDRSVTYNLTANYTKEETPQSIRYELAALRMLAGR